MVVSRVHHCSHALSEMPETRSRAGVRRLRPMPLKFSDFFLPLLAVRRPAAFHHRGFCRAGARCTPVSEHYASHLMATNVATPDSAVRKKCRDEREARNGLDG